MRYVLAHYWNDTEGITEVLSEYHVVYDKFHIDWLGTEFRLAVNRLSHGMA
jgi:hypothetical protein